MKYIICFLFFFTASCVSTRKYYRSAQKIVDWAQNEIHSIQSSKSKQTGDTIPEIVRSMLPFLDSIFSFTVGQIDSYSDVCITTDTSFKQTCITVFWDEGKIRVVDRRTKDASWVPRKDWYKQEKGYKHPGCVHIWVATERDTVYNGLLINDVYYPRGQNIVCIRCLTQKQQIVIQESNLKWWPGKIESDTVRWPLGPWIVPNSNPEKRKP